MREQSLQGDIENEVFQIIAELVKDFDFTVNEAAKLVVSAAQKQAGE